MRANGYHKYELLSCVSIIQHKGCMGATEYRKYEVLACVSIHRASTSASTSCWNVSHRTVRGLHARERVPQVRAVDMCQHHTAQGMHGRDRGPQVRAVGMCKHPQHEGASTSASKS